jgi:pSer/pThr/pTyr-binding forkhead associated (FHA) protein
MEPFACLYIEKGEPYQAGACLVLEADETVIGRTSSDQRPDIAFANAFVSRRHLVIRRDNDGVFLCDLGSKHGTEVGGTRVPPHTPVPLRNKDTISLAGGLVVLRYSDQLTDQTLELERSEIERRLAHLPTRGEPAFRIDKEKRVCHVHGQPVFMTDKEWRLFTLLYEQATLLVPLDEIKRAVWPERSYDGGVPDVGNDELTSLVYRIRKKLQKSPLHIHTVRGSGYLLEEE